MTFRTSLSSQIDALYRSESRRVYASLVRLLGDLDLADDAMHEAFAAAVVAWQQSGIPDNPAAWLVSTGKFQAIDTLRRQGRLKNLQPEIAARLEQVAEANACRTSHEIEDDRLRLIFTCCHPAVDTKLRVPLTLREVCGLTTEEIARAFLTTKGAMAQLIVRGKSKIREAKLPYTVPPTAELPGRLNAVLATIYLVFNEGYSASRGESLTRVDLSEEAIRLARLLCELLPNPEGHGLLALMLLHESRRKSRVSSDGEIILLEDQDRSKWNATLIAEGTTLVEQALKSRRFGAYTLQAAISAVHAETPNFEQTDWSQIVILYAMLLKLAPSPVVELNRAVAIAMRDGPLVGLALIDEILIRGDLLRYHLAYSAKGELLRRAGRPDEAILSFQVALELAEQEPEKRLMRRRIAELTHQFF